MAANTVYVEFKLQSGVVRIDEAALGSMKMALLSFLDGADYPARFSELREGFRAELQRAAPWMAAGSAGIGLWRLENQDGRLALVRYPPPAVATSYIYHALLRTTDSGWRVHALEQEREAGPQ